MTFWGNLSKIFRGCFEPLFVAMAIALLVWAWAGVKNRDWRHCVAPAAVALFMVAWRCFIPNFYSHRYAAAVALPAILFSGWLLRSLRGGFAATIVDAVSQKCHWVSRRLVLTVAVVMIVGGSLLASLNVDRDMRFIVDAAHVVAQDAQGRGTPLLLSYTKETWLLEMFGKLPVTHAKIKIDNDPPDVAMLRQTLRENSRHYSAIYVFCTQPPGQEMTAAELALPGKWERVFARPMGHRKKRYFHVYRYEDTVSPAAVAASSEDDGAAPPPPAGRGKTIRPRGGQFSFSPGNPAAHATVERGSEGAFPLRIATQYVKRNERPPFILSRHKFTTSTPVTLTFQAQGKAGTDIVIAAYYFSATDKTVRQVIPVLPLRIAVDDAAATYRCEFLPGFFPGPDGKFRILFAVARGEAAFGDISYVISKKQAVAPPPALR